MEGKNKKNSPYFLLSEVENFLYSIEAQVCNFKVSVLSLAIKDTFQHWHKGKYSSRDGERDSPFLHLMFSFIDIS